MDLRPTYPLRTERLLLRPYAESDIEAVVDVNSRPDVVRYIPWGVLDREGAAALLARRMGETAITDANHHIVLAATIPPDDRVVGEFMLKILSEAHHRGEIGWMIHPDIRGRGYATEGANEMLRLGFEDAGLHSIVAEADARNRASVALMGRLGMQHEATFRENEGFKSEWSSSTVWGILESEWRARRA